MREDFYSTAENRWAQMGLKDNTGTVKKGEGEISPKKQKDLRNTRKKTKGTGRKTEKQKSNELRRVG